MTPPITTTQASSQSYFSDQDVPQALPQQPSNFFTLVPTSRTEIYETKPAATPLADTARSIWDSVVSWWNGPEPLPGPVIQTEEVRAEFDPIASSHCIYEATQGGLTGLGTDEEGLIGELKDLTPEQNKAFNEVHLSHYGVSVQQHTGGELSGLKQEEVSVRLRGEQLGGDAMALGDAFRYGTGTLWDLARTGTDEAKVFATLEGKTPDELREIDRVFTHRFGISLSAALASELSGHDLALAQALLSGRETTAQAVRLQRALEGWSVDTDAIENILTTAPAEQREKIVNELSGTDYEITLSLLKGDEVTSAQKIRHAVEGVGTDEAALLDSLRGRSTEELAQVRADYLQRYGETLDTRVLSELSGRDHFLAKQYLQGTPEDAETALSKLRDVGSHFAGGFLGGASRETVDQKTWQSGFIKGIQQVGKTAIQEGGVGIVAGQAFRASSHVVGTAYKNSKFWFYNKKLPESLRPVFTEVKNSPLFGIRAQEHFEELRKRFGDDKLVEMSRIKTANLQAELLLLELEHFDPALGSMLKINNKQLVLNEDTIKRVKRSMSSFEYARGRIPEEIIQSLNERFCNNMLIEKQRQSET